ncbi:MAG: hypothetical protein WBW72_00230 [Erwinia billingiae]
MEFQPGPAPDAAHRVWIRAGIDFAKRSGFQETLFVNAAGYIAGWRHFLVFPLNAFFGERY